MYTVNEGDGSVEICFVIFEPSDTSLLDVNAFAEFGSQTNNGTACKPYSQPLPSV